jgi:hypothetical protein
LCTEPSLRLSRVSIIASAALARAGAVSVQTVRRPA